MTFRKSRGANQSVGVTMSVLPQRMNCLPASSVNRPRLIVVLRRRIASAGRSRPRSEKSTRQLASTWSCVLARMSPPAAN